MILEEIKMFFGWFKYLLYAVFIYLNLEINSMNVVGGMISINMLSGVIKSIVVPTLKFNSKKLLKGMLAKVVTILLPVVLALASKGFGGELTWFVNAVVKVIILTELLSILANFKAIGTKKEVQETDYLVLIVDKSKTKIRNMIDKLFELDE